MRRHLNAPNHIAVVLTTLLGLVAPATVAAGEPAPAVREPHARDAVLVSFRPGTSVSARAAAADRVDARASTRLSRLAPGAVRLKLPRGMTVEEALKRLRKLPGVDYAEPDYHVASAVTANDPYFTGGSLWGMYGAKSAPANAFGSAAAEAWGLGRTGSRQVYVGILDQGVQFNHPDLAANVWTNPHEIAGDGVDNDGNGFVDDIHGWDFVADDASVYDGGSTASEDNHGTHVAGTIGAIGGNGVGVAGVNWRVTMIPTKFMGSGGGYISDAVRALDYLTDLHWRHGLNIVASNNSWGGGDYSQTLLDAIERAGDAGMLFVAAAGNSASNNDVAASWPTNYRCTSRADGSPRGYDCVISVAALTSSGALASYSDYGATSVDLAAPGSNVTSTVPLNRYAAYSGTSMATPHVSGALALCASIAGLGAADLRAAVINSAAPTPSLLGKMLTGGRLDVRAMVEWCALSDQPVIGAPHGLVATALGTRSVALAWVNDARNERGFEIQQATVKGGNCGTFSVLARPGPDTTAFQADGMLPGTEYCFRVRATNSFGGGSYSEWSNVARTVMPALPVYECGPVEYAWTDANGAGHALSDDGSLRVNLPSGFGFAFYGQPATWVDISANGFLAIGLDSSPANPWANTPLPASDQPNSLAAAWWDDLNPSNETRIWTHVVGTAPNRVFVAEWRDVKPFVAGATSGVTFEVRLDEASDAITFSYKDVSAGVPGFDGGGTATVGVEDQLGLTGALISYNTASLANRTSYRCAPASGSASPDTTAPTALAPTAVLGSLQRLGSQARIHLDWPASSDPSGIVGYDLQYRIGSGAWTSVALSSPVAQSVDFGVTPGQSYAFRVGARDGAGNVGWSAPVTVKLALRQEGNAALTYSGAFKLTRLDGASGGKVRHTAIGGRTAKFTFSGTGVGFVTTFGPKRGIAQVWLDGAKVATLDLYAAVRQTRMVAWSAALSSGAHVLEIRTTGTRNPLAASNRIDIDAFIVRQ